MGIFFLIISFVLGAVLGSFVNAVVYRLRENLPIFKARSMCPHCHKQISNLDLIPVISFLLLGGRCRNCGKKISWQYPLVELATGLLFAGSFYISFGLNPANYPIQDVIALIFRFILLTVLMILFVYDLKFMEIPDKVVIPGIIMALVINISQIGLNYLLLRQSLASNSVGKYLLSNTNFLNTNLWDNTTPYLYGAAAGLILAAVFYLIVLLSRERAMGGGDIKLAVLIGLVLPWPYIIPALYIGFLIGALVGLGLLISQRKKMRTLIPLAPFLITGVFAAMFFGSNLLKLIITLKPF